MKRNAGPQINGPKTPASEKGNGSIDAAFEELVGIAARGPEARQEAARIAIDQIRMIGEEMRQLRSFEQIHNLKKRMLTQWRELEEATKGNPELFQEIQDWGKRFNEEKVLFYEAVSAIKDELISKSQRIKSLMTDIQVLLGRIAGPGGVSGWVMDHKADLALGTEFDFLAEKDKPAPLYQFAQSVEHWATAFEGDIDIDAGTAALAALDNLLRNLNQEAYDPTAYRGALAEHSPGTEKALDDLKSAIQSLSSEISEVSRIYQGVKILRDTHFLKISNSIKSE